MLNTHVIGSVSQDKSDELIVLTDDVGIPSAIVMAVPYIRDRDVRSGIDANSIHQKISSYWRVWPNIITL